MKLWMNAGRLVALHEASGAWGVVESDWDHDVPAFLADGGRRSDGPGRCWPVQTGSRAVRRSGSRTRRRRCGPSRRRPCGRWPVGSRSSPASSGEQWAQSSTAGPLHGLGAAVAYAARGESLGPGDVLSTGTLPGCCGLEMRRFPKAGDVVRLEVEAIGTLTNTIGRPR